MESNYVELTGRLHSWRPRQTRNGGTMASGWIEVKRLDLDGTTKFPLVSWDPDKAWEDYVDCVVSVAGHLVWQRNGDGEGFEVVVCVDAMTFVRATRDGNGKSAPARRGTLLNKTPKTSRQTRRSSNVAEEDDF